MCGIAGIFRRDSRISPLDESGLNQILEKLAYRGPDGFGIWKSDHALLGHRRLSIIDLSSAGAQPFVSDELGLVITFNGEIYNFQELKARLSSVGYSFRSQSDTEVILYAYDHFGPDFLLHLRGMFAFCLFDQKRNVAIIARDPAGEKPLYYYGDDKCLIFSSEIKGFHAFPFVDLSIDANAVRAFFTLQYIPGPHTVYKKVRKLSAGHVLTIHFDDWDVRESQYWSLEGNNSVSASPAEIDSLLSQSVRYRLVADVEVGLLLSGGIDSALLALYAHENGAKLRAFTARFDDKELDESGFAKQVADCLGFQQIVITGEQLTPEIFEKVIFHGDELLGDPACVPTFLLSREISKHVKVVLSGEGADELFWGYDTYRFEQKWQYVSWLRDASSRIPGFQRLISGMESSTWAPAGITRIGKVLTASHDLGAARWTSVFADYTVGKLVTSDDAFQQVDYLQEIQLRILTLRQSMNSLDAALAGDLLYWLADDLLMKVDRMTMAYGVEARAPFLDKELIHKARCLSAHHKLKGRSGKFILRTLVEEKFPQGVGKTIARRKKHGFEVPVTSWLRGSLRDYVEDRLSSRALDESGLISSAFATKLKERFYSSESNSTLRRKMWLLLCFQTWYEMHERKFGFT